MENEISLLISRYLTLSSEEAEAITENLPVKEFKKGTILLREGQVSKTCYFNIQGLVRKYFIVNGEEWTVEFYTEEQSIASLQSYLNKTPANHYFECLEDCRLAVLQYEREQELFKRVPGFESLCRVSMEEDFGKQQETLASYITTSPESRYLDLLKSRPDLIKRVPQYHLSSYLGVKPESLSRIRKRIASKS
jgi:CRP-like cAMP-binding protein